ncbi:MAG: hypothetical protein KKE02_15065 [Alphaproteobacteria bacterium]|nr:hypothetical protein [Alphaproteobacteria bacterium]MBU1516181.1 hypothetical protein [Alphaproteobacteria bacterium]MBU2093491.1 hypothetical protein [Alphaproteobacteria bacterium]MBU2152339.1 hypothetical protein [Alphaproteobacteria bacterium]MBU2308153.1 hypothetical protein [Alphaproteobacteria bacterium]
MRWVSLCAACVIACGATACASRGAGPEVAAVVQDEQARQAAAATAQQGESAKDSLKAGAEAASKATAPADPPI